MFDGLLEKVLPRIIGVRLRWEKISLDEIEAQRTICNKLNMSVHKTDEQVIVAFVGLVGSGKSSVANELANHIGATVISADDIRNELRKRKASYNKVRLIVENLAIDAIKYGTNVIIDSDFVD